MKTLNNLFILSGLLFLSFQIQAQEFSTYYKGKKVYYNILNDEFIVAFKNANTVNQISSLNKGYKN